MENKDNKNSLAYKVGQGMAVVFYICLAAILMALTAVVVYKLLCLGGLF